MADYLHLRRSLLKKPLQNDAIYLKGMLWKKVLLGYFKQHLSKVLNSFEATIPLDFIPLDNSFSTYAEFSEKLTFLNL